MMPILKNLLNFPLSDNPIKNDLLEIDQKNGVPQKVTPNRYVYIFISFFLLLLLALVIAASFSGKDTIDDNKREKHRCQEGWQGVNRNFCYKAFKAQKSFNDAKFACELVKGHLASIHDSTEQNIIKGLIQPMDEEQESSVEAGYWLGIITMHRKVKPEGYISLLNIDKTDFKNSVYGVWSSELKKNDHDQDYCTIMLNRRDQSFGLWKEVNCTGEAIGYVCKKSLDRVVL